MKKSVYNNYFYKTLLPKKNMMYNSYPNFYDSYYFLTLPHNPIYFTYDPLSNSVKTSSNIILIKD